MAIKLLSAGGGSVTLDVPSTASNVEMTVPVNAGTIITSNEQVGFRNRIINGAIEVSQRGTSVTFLNSGSYLVDRWSCGGFQQSRHSRVSVTSPNAAMKARFALRSASSTTSEVAGGTRMDATQKIESFNCVGLSGKPVTFSFWLRCSSASFASVTNTTTSAYSGLQYRLQLNTSTTDSGVGSDTGDLGAGRRTISNGSLPTVWTKYVVTETLPTGVNNISIRFQTNDLGSTATAGENWFEITEIQLEEGSTATSFEFRPFGAELALCQRYYYKTVSEAIGDDLAVGSNVTTTASRVMVFFPTQMRTPPTALEQSGTAGDYSVRHAATLTACSSVPTFFNANKNTANTQLTVSSGLTGGQGSFVRAVNTNAFLAWSAEL